MAAQDPTDQGKRLQEALEAPTPQRPFGEWENDVGPGWRTLIRGLHENLLEIDADYRIGQIKEKFGGLRYYLDGIEGDTEEAYRLIRAAEDVSFKICEDCGAPGDCKAHNGHWVRTLCPRCVREEQDEREFKEALAKGELELVSDDEDEQ